MNIKTADRIEQIALLVCGISLMSSLWWLWHAEPDLAVLTIFPMMGAPYIVGIGLIASGLAPR